VFIVNNYKVCLSLSDHVYPEVLLIPGRSSLVRWAVSKRRYRTFCLSTPAMWTCNKAIFGGVGVFSCCLGLWYSRSVGDCGSRACDCPSAAYAAGLHTRL